MKNKLKLTLYILPLLVIISVNIAYSDNNYSGLTFTFSAGPSYVSGFYEPYINDGYTASFNTYYNYPLFAGNTYFKGGLSYFSYDLKSNNDSFMNQFDAMGGIGIIYPLFSYVDIVAGADIHGVYSNLKTYNTMRNENVVKPAVSFNTGIMTSLGRGIGLCVLADYRLMKISGEKFSSADITAGITYNYNSYLGEIEKNTRSEKKLTIFNKGLEEFKKKNLNEAKELLFELYNIDRSYPGLDYYLKRIEEIEQSRKTADSLIAQQNYLKAIPHLEGCSAYIKECELQLLGQRKALKVNVPAWEADAIRFYDKKNYRECIELMEKILLVDPENQNANVYLPRAVKRQKAIDSLQGR